MNLYVINPPSMNHVASPHQASSHQVLQILIPVSLAKFLTHRTIYYNTWHTAHDIMVDDHVLTYVFYF